MVGAGGTHFRLRLQPVAIRWGADVEPWERRGGTECTVHMDNGTRQRAREFAHWQFSGQQTLLICLLLQLDRHKYVATGIAEWERAEIQHKGKQTKK